MKIPRHKFIPSIFLLTLVLWSCKSQKLWEGQEPVKKVNTESVPIQLQHKGVFDLGDGVFISNNFEGARLNGVVRNNDTLVTVLITPENSPINMSPWYAFKLWSESPRTLYLKLTYPENASHRYLPKLSFDGLQWREIDTASFQTTQMKLSLGEDTLWVSAQELLTNTHVEQWISQLETNTYVERSSIGESFEGRPIHLLKIGESDDQKMIMVISRQHPPEIPGFLAMQAFVETLCAPTELAEAFRKKYNTYVLPMANPDGVFHGHWRHNRGGVDLNRDWHDFNQPETSAIRDFMKQKTKAGKGKFHFSVDFHSTFEDIYYTIDPQLKGNLPGLVPELIEATGQELQGYTPNVKPNSSEEARITSTSFLFYEMGAEALTYEIGDDTPRDFIRRKGEVTATKLMELLVN
jgi:predicted deacylase